MVKHKKIRPKSILPQMVKTLLHCLQALSMAAWRVSYLIFHFLFPLSGSNGGFSFYAQSSELLPDVSRCRSIFFRSSCMVLDGFFQCEIHYLSPTHEIFFNYFFNSFLLPTFLFCTSRIHIYGCKTLWCIFHISFSLNFSRSFFFFSSSYAQSSSSLVPNQQLSLDSG